LDPSRNRNIYLCNGSTVYIPENTITATTAVR
jgi:hypothetical protein